MSGHHLDKQPLARYGPDTFTYTLAILTQPLVNQQDRMHSVNWHHYYQAMGEAKQSILMPPKVTLPMKQQSGIPTSNVGISSPGKLVLSPLMTALTWQAISSAMRFALVIINAKC